METESWGGKEEGKRARFLKASYLMPGGPPRLRLLTMVPRMAITVLPSGSGVPQQGSLFNPAMLHALPRPRQGKVCDRPREMHRGPGT